VVLCNFNNIDIKYEVCAAAIYFVHNKHLFHMQSKTKVGNTLTG